MTETNRMHRQHVWCTMPDYARGHGRDPLTIYETIDGGEPEPVGILAEPAQWPAPDHPVFNQGRNVISREDWHAMTTAFAEAQDDDPTGALTDGCEP